MAFFFFFAFSSSGDADRSQDQHQNHVRINFSCDPERNCGVVYSDDLSTKPCDAAFFRDSSSSTIVPFDTIMGRTGSHRAVECALCCCLEMVHVV